MLAIATHRQAVEIRDLGGIARSLHIREISLVLGKRRYLHVAAPFDIQKGCSGNILEDKTNAGHAMCGCYEHTSSTESVTLLWGVLLLYPSFVLPYVFCPLPTNFYVTKYTSMVTDSTESWVPRNNTQVLCAHHFFDVSVPSFHFTIQTLRPLLYILYHWSYSQDCQPFGSNFFFHRTDPQGELSLYSENPNAKIYFFKLKLDPVVKLFRLHFEHPWTKSVEQECTEYLWHYITHRTSSRNSNLLRIGRKKISTMP